MIACKNECGTILVCDYLQSVGLGVYHAVLWLQVSMSYPSAVHVSDCTQQLLEVMQAQLFWHSIVTALDVVKQIRTTHQLKLQSRLNLPNMLCKLNCQLTYVRNSYIFPMGFGKFGDIACKRIVCI